MTPEAYHAWVNRDLAPHLHREAYLHVLRESGLADHHAETLYEPGDRPVVLDALSGHRRGAQGPAPAGHQDRGGLQHRVRRASGFRWRSASPSDVDEFVLSFEVGAVKPDAAIFETALSRLGVEAAHAVMVGDSDEADGGARAIGCGFALVDPLPTAQRTDGLTSALTEYGVAL